MGEYPQLGRDDHISSQMDESRYPETHGDLPAQTHGNGFRFDSTPYYHVGEPYRWETLVDEMREQAQFMEDTGFTTMWFAEHHLWHDNWYRSPPNGIMTALDVALHTKRLRVGQFPIVLPDWHPIRVAEDVSLLDHFTKGRLDVGVGRGVNNRIARQFNVDADRHDDDRNFTLFREAFEVIIKAWTEDVFSYKGEIYQFPVPGWREKNTFFTEKDPRCYAPDGELIAIGVRPQPYQKPYPPVFQCSDNPRSIEFAAEKGIGVISFFHTLEGYRKIFTLYRDVASRVQGRNVPFGENTCVSKPVYIAPTMEEAVKDAREGTNLLYGYASGLRDTFGRQAFLGGGKELTEEDLNDDWFDFLSKREQIWVGTPDSVAEIISKWSSELNCRHFALFLNIPELPFTKVMRGLELFAEKVMPRFEVSKVA